MSGEWGRHLTLGYAVEAAQHGKAYVMRVLPAERVDLRPATTQKASAALRRPHVRRGFPVRRLKEVPACRTVKRRAFDNARILHLKSEFARTGCAIARIANAGESKARRFVARHRKREDRARVARPAARGAHPRRCFPESQLWYAPLFCDFVCSHAEEAGPCAAPRCHPPPRDHEPGFASRYMRARESHQELGDNDTR